MAFPTIPTVASGRILTSVNSDTNPTRISLNLSGLTKNAGDLIVAIVIAYQTSTGTNAAFSSWLGGVTEVADRATSTTMAIGVATKISTGSENTSVSVTQAGTITGHACWIILSIPGAHQTTAVEVSPKTDGTTTAATVSAFNPTGWDVEDTLWIHVIGSGELNTTGTYTGVTAAGSGYTNFAATAASGDVAGAVQGAVAFLQWASAAQDALAATVDTSNARNSALVVAVRPAPPVEISSVGSNSTTASGTAQLTVEATSVVINPPGFWYCTVNRYFSCNYNHLSWFGIGNCFWYSSIEFSWSS
jgi:hypothetical protein